MSEDPWFETHFELRVGLSLTVHPVANWGPGRNTRKDKGCEERNCPPYLTKLMAQDQCSLYQALPNLQIVYGTYLLTTL